MEEYRNIDQLDMMGKDSRKLLAYYCQYIQGRIIVERLLAVMPCHIWVKVFNIFRGKQIFGEKYIIEPIDTCINKFPALNTIITRQFDKIIKIDVIKKY